MFRNLLDRFRNPSWARTRQHLRRAWRVAWPILTGLVVIVGLAAAWFGPAARTVYKEALAAKADLEVAQTMIVSQEFTEGQAALTSGRAHLLVAQEKMGRLLALRRVPIAGPNVRAIDQLIAASLAMTSGVERLSTWAETVVKPFKTGKSFSLSTLKPEQKRAILEAIYQAQPDLQAAKSSLDLALTHVEAMPTSGLLGPVAEAVEPFREKLPALRDGIEQAIPASRIVPPILGYPDQQNYLFLLQNNTELRPTGGFIGTYGILKARDGEILSFTTDNVYNLDDQAKYLNVKPPTPLTTYMRVNRWLFRDSNWSPDFPTAAQEALSFYRREGGPERKLDGVIAVDPTFFERLLTLTGPITVGKTEFRTDNLVEELQYITGYAYEGKINIDTSQRKNIIGTLGQELIARMLNLPKEKYGKAWTIFQESLQEKHLLIWVANAERQEIARSLGWAGNVVLPQGDSLMVVDANLASLKSDPAVKRTLNYRVRREGDDVLATLNIRYEHTGELTWKTTRYRTYTRVYVPRGSTLVASSGAMTECNVKKEGTVQTSEELGHTVFAAFTCTEVGATKELSLTYRLNGSPLALLDQGKYKLLVQKQPGTIAHTLNVDVDLDREIQDTLVLPETAAATGTRLQDATTLLVDREYDLTLD